MTLIFLAVFVIVFLFGIRVVSQYETGIVFRFGKIVSKLDPGFNFVIPFIDYVTKVDLRTQTLLLESQSVITKDNISLGVSAVAYFKIADANKTIVEVQDVNSAVDQLAQTILRNIIGQFEFDDILSKREEINKQIKSAIDEHTEPWGIAVSLVEIKDISLPENMQRAMAKQAEAEREKRAKIINAEGEKAAATILEEAASILGPVAVQLRTLQTLAEISTEHNSTIIFPAEFGGLTKFFGNGNGK